MNKGNLNRRKLRYAGTSAVLTALIIAAVIIVNVIFSALSTKFLWYVDMTPDMLFTLSDECFDLIENGDDSFSNSSSPIEMVKKIREENRQYNAENGLVKGDADYRDEDLSINIIFCDDIDVLEDNLTQKYVYHTALELQDKFPEYIKVKNYNIIRNPSSVTKYKVTHLTDIYTTSVIVEFGTESRVYPLRSFYTFSNSTDEEPWAYNAEKKFASGILAVTRAESPVACVTTNHGETMSDTELLYTLQDAGYIVRDIDLAQDEIPENCRLIVVYNPISDFLVKDGISDIDEIQKLDDFLDGTNSMMVFMSPDSPVLNHFEEYIEEWGISFDRYTDVSGEQYSYLVEDKSQSLTTDGYTLVSEYVTDGLGGSLTEEMRSRGVPKKVIFPNAMSISYSDRYSRAHYVDEEDETISYDYGSYYNDGVSRSIFNAFVTSKNAVAYANGIEAAKASDTDRFALMTVSMEDRTTQESNYTTVSEASYVIAFGSTDFASQKMLQSESYGNSDLLLSAFSIVGREPVPVGLDLKPFADSTIDTITSAEATQYTVVFAVIPVVASLVAGVIVIVRRKNR